MSNRHLTIGAFVALCAFAIVAPSAARADGPLEDILNAGAWLHAEKTQGPAVDAIIGATLANIRTVYEANYAPNAQFNDPTSHVVGRSEIIAHLETALQSVTIDAIRVKSRVHGPNGAWIVSYEMDAHLSYPVAPGVILPLGDQFTLFATTELRFEYNKAAKKYLVVYHHDVWDQLAAFAQIPNLLGTVYGMVGQWIGAQLGAPPAP